MYTSHCNVKVIPFDKFNFVKLHNIKVDIAIIDIEKAFDKVAHKRLSEKHQYYGIDGTTRIWIDAFLSKRIQRVVVDGEASMCSHVTSGVPQGALVDDLFLCV
jgi:hypothetical protein